MIVIRMSDAYQRSRIVSTGRTQRNHVTEKMLARLIETSLTS